MSIHTPFGQLKCPPSLLSSSGAASAPEEALIPPMQPDSSGANVLIVDHDPIACAKIGAWFSHHGHSVALACTHDMAAALRRDLVFHLIVCDSAAPNPAARKWIDDLLVSAPCPVILITANPTLEVAIRAANLAVAGYLAKPIDFAELANIVARVLRLPG